MSDKDINQMDFKELRNEVQLLRDELAIMQRKYEDLFYNLDTENFSSNVKNKLESKLTSGEVQTMISQSAEEVKIYAKEEASSYSNSVESRLSVNINGISLAVYELSSSVSDIKQTSESIEMRVRDIIDGEESAFIQTSDGFVLDGNRVIISNSNKSEENTGVYGDSYVKVLNRGLNLYLYDKETQEYYEKVGIGLYRGYYDHPYITLGAGTGENLNEDRFTGKKIGCVYKLGNGLWIGDASACNVGGRYPCGKDSPESILLPYTDGSGAQRSGDNITGIFIDLVNGEIYKYEKGICTQI